MVLNTGTVPATDREWPDYVRQASRDSVSKHEREANMLHIENPG